MTRAKYPLSYRQTLLQTRLPNTRATRDAHALTGEERASITLRSVPITVRSLLGAGATIFNIDGCVFNAETIKDIVLFDRPATVREVRLKIETMFGACCLYTSFENGVLGEFHREARALEEFAARYYGLDTSHDSPIGFIHGDQEPRS